MLLPLREETFLSGNFAFALLRIPAKKSAQRAHETTRWAILLIRSSWFWFR